MPKSTEYYNDSTGRQRSRETGMDEGAVAAAARQAKAASTMGKKGSLGKGAMPKQSDYPDLKSYMEAMRKYRENAATQADAIKNKP